MHCTRRNVRIPPDPILSPQPPSSPRNYGRLCVCCYPRHCPPPPRRPSLPFPGQTGHEESPAESYSQHTYTHTLFPRCRCAPNTDTHTYIYLYTHTNACIIIQSSSSSPPRVTATSSAPRFLVLRYWHIASSLSLRFTGLPTVPSTPTLPRLQRTPS